MGRIAEPPARRSGPPGLDAEIAALAARQGGVVALAQLGDLGLGARAAQLRARAGRLHRVHRGVYAVGHPAVGADGRRWAAVLACGPGAVLSHRSAGEAWDLRAGAAARHDVSTARRGRTGPPGVRLHRVRRLHADDVTALDGLPITTVARTLVDLAGALPAAALERALHQAEIREVLDADALAAAIERAPGRRGTGTLRRLLGDPSAGATRSVLEERFLALVAGSDLPRPRLNAHVLTAIGWIEVDALWAAHGVVVELDGYATHRTRRSFEIDRRRDAALAAEGHRVVRLTWARVTGDGDGVVAELRRALGRIGEARAR